MSPERFYHHHQHYDRHPHSIINGPRPSPLKINKASHLIHKQSSSSHSFLRNSQTTAFGGETKQQKMQKNNPVIIYTHSPKVIHTQARDFMALVQKLTGLSSCRNDLLSTQQRQREGGDAGNTYKAASKSKRGIDDDNCSILTDENCGGNGGCANNYCNDINSPILDPPKNPHFADIPLFTPPATVDYFRSPRPLYRHSDSAGYASPSIADSISRSV